MQTTRDQEIVDWIGRLGAAGAEHVMGRFVMGRSPAKTPKRVDLKGRLREES